jgi:peptide chain release factor 1
MLDKLAQIERRFAEIEAQVADPETFGDRDRVARLMRERAELEEIVVAYRRRCETESALEEAKAMRDDADPEIREMAGAEIRQLESRLDEQDAGLRMLLVPKDPLDQRNAIVEIRARTRTDFSSTRAACTACSACPRPSRRAASTPRP